MTDPNAVRTDIDSTIALATTSVPVADLRATVDEVRRQLMGSPALSSDLRALLEGRVVTAYERGAAAEVRKWVRRNRALAVLFVVLAVALPLGASLATYVVATRGQVLAAEDHARAERVESALEDGFLQLGEGDSTRALAHFERALADEPASIEALAGRAIALQRLRRFEDSLAVLQGAADTDEPGLAMLRADALLALGRADEIEDPAAFEPDELHSPLAAWLVGQREMARGHEGEQQAYARALEQFERAVRLSPSARPLFVYSLAHALAHVRDRERGLEVGEMIEVLWPEGASSLHWAGFARTAAGDLERGTELLRQAHELHPEENVHRFGLAWALQLAGEHEEAEHLYRQMIEEFPHAFSPYENLSMLLRRSAEYEEALELARAAVDIAPEHAVVHETLGTTLRSAGRSEEALPHFEQALRLDPGRRSCRRVYAESLADVRRYHDAKAQLRMLLDEDPTDARSWAKLGEVELQAGDQETAVEHLFHALRIDRHEVAAHIQLGLLAAGRGSWTSASEHYSAALIGDPTEPRAHYNLGCVHLRFRRREQAAECFRSAIRYEPGLAEAHCNLGQALRRMGRYDEAVVAFRRGHELGTARDSWGYDSATWLAEAEALAADEARFLELLAEPTLAPAVERAELARHGVATGRGAQALPLFVSATEEDPEVVEAMDPDWLALAGRAALQAAAEPGAPAEEHRQRALAWFEQHLGRLELLLVDGELGEAEVLAALDELHDDRQLAELRAPTVLDELPADEADGWHAYWETLEEIRAALRE